MVVVFQIMVQKLTIRESRAVRDTGITQRKLENMKSQLSNTLQIESASHFPIQIMPISDFLTLLAAKRNKINDKRRAFSELHLVYFETSNS